MDGYLTSIQALQNFKKIMEKFNTVEDSQLRFDTHMELVRISSPSRYEKYRGIAVAKRFKEMGFADEDIIFNISGNMPGAAIQLIDDKPVWNACAILKGSQPDSVVDNINIFSRPKVVIEAHIDTVNPSEIDLKSDVITDKNYDKIRLQPISEPLADTPAKLAAITRTLNFDANGKIIKDDNYNAAYKRYDNATVAKEANALRIYIPGYSDAMGNVNGVLAMARLVKENPIKPVHDIWFCTTSGEEGRGNLAGMKQLYGYNQQATAEKGKNSLNIVANLSIDGGTIGIHFLGSYRYEVNYKANDPKASAALAAAYAIEKIAKLRSPSEEDKNQPKTTYTVGMVYPVTNPESTTANSVSTSFEIDMRSPVPEVLDVMRDKILPNYPLGASDENARSGVADGVVQSVKWFGDRPAHRRMPEAMKADPYIYAAWQSYNMVRGLSADKRLKLDQYPKDSSSLNDNIPAAIGVPSVNMALSANATGGGGHAFNEWGVPGTIEAEAKNFERVLLTLFAVAGVTNDDDSVLVPAAYPDKAPRHVNGAVDKWN